jgi:hypothetical protein
MDIMSPLDTETMVALHVDEILREHEDRRLGWEARDAVQDEKAARCDDWTRLHQPARRAFGEALIRVGLWLTKGAPVPAARC